MSVWVSVSVVRVLFRGCARAWVCVSERLASARIDPTAPIVCFFFSPLCITPAPFCTFVSFWLVCFFASCTEFVGPCGYLHLLILCPLSSEHLSISSGRFLFSLLFVNCFDLSAIFPQCLPTYRTILGCSR